MKQWNRSGVMILRVIVMVMVASLAISLTACTSTPGGDAPGRQANTPMPAVSLQALIDQAADDTVLHIPPGRHLLEQGLVIQGRRNLRIICGPETQILLADLNQDVVTIRASRGIRLEGGHFRHVTPLKEYECHGGVVRVMGSRDVAIVSATLDGCGAVGVAAQEVSDLLVEHCHIHSNTFNAIYLSQVRGVRIVSNIIERNANAMQLYQVDDMMMSDNLIRDNTGYWRVPVHPPGLMSDD